MFKWEQWNALLSIFSIKPKYHRNYDLKVILKFQLPLPLKIVEWPLFFAVCLAILFERYLERFCTFNPFFVTFGWCNCNSVWNRLLFSDGKQDKLIYNKCLLKLFLVTIIVTDSIVKVRRTDLYFVGKILHKNMYSSDTFIWNSADF